MIVRIAACHRALAVFGMILAAFKPMGINLSLASKLSALTVVGVFF